MATVSVEILGRYTAGPSPNRVAETRQVDPALVEMLFDDPNANGPNPELRLFDGSGAVPMEGRPQRELNVAGEDAASLVARLGNLEEVKILRGDRELAKPVAKRDVPRRAWINLARVRTVVLKPDDAASVVLHSYRAFFVSEPSAALVALA